MDLIAKERDRLLQRTARIYGLSFTIVSLICLSIPGSVNAVAYFIALPLYAIVAVSQFRLGVSRSLLWIGPGILAGIAAIVVIAIAALATHKSPAQLAWTLFQAGSLATATGDETGAQAFVAESLARYRAAHNRQRVARVLMHRCSYVITHGRYAEAAAMAQECLPIFRETGFYGSLSAALNLLGRAVLGLGEFDRAVALDPRTHFVVESLARRNVDPGRRELLHARFRKAALARARAAEDQFACHCSGSSLRVEWRFFYCSALYRPVRYHPRRLPRQG